MVPGVRSGVMSIGKMTKSLPLNSDASIALILIMNVFSWYFPLYIFLTDNLKDVGIGHLESLIIFGFHIVVVLVVRNDWNKAGRKVCLPTHIACDLGPSWSFVFAFFVVLRSGDLLSISAVTTSFALL